MRAAVSITRAADITDDRWIDFTNDVRDSVSDQSYLIRSTSGPATGPDRLSWVADFIDADVPLAKAALSEISARHGQDVEWLAVADDARRILTRRRAEENVRHEALSRGRDIWDRYRNGEISYGIYVAQTSAALDWWVGAIGEVAAEYAEEKD